MKTPPGFGAAHASSPDVRYVDQFAWGGSVPAGLRSLDADCPWGQVFNLTLLAPLRPLGPRFVAAHAPSPDVRYVDQSAWGGSVPAGLRSLDADCAPASCLRWSATPALEAWAAPHGFRTRVGHQ